MSICRYSEGLPDSAHHAPPPDREFSLEYWAPHSGPCTEDEVSWLSSIIPDSTPTPTGKGAEEENKNKNKNF